MSVGAGANPDVDVLVVGGGPVGLLGGILAARRGLRVEVIERRDGSQTAPAAHVVNSRTFEICRQAGIDVAELEAASAPFADCGHVNFVTRLGGELIGRLPYERQSIDDRTLSPTPLRNLSQHRLEPILARHYAEVQSTGVRYGTRWESVVEDAEGVTSTVTDAAGARRQIRSRWLIGCDGAGSRVRQSIGIEMNGPPLISSFLMVHLAADFRNLVADHPAILHFVLDPEASGVFVAHDIDHDWVFMRAIDAPDESAADFDDARCRRIVEDALGTAAPFEIAGIGTWRMSSQIATDMRRRRILLAGDAAHRFPPTGGMGLNSGAADIHGLMWRLGAVTDGWADESLLDSYAAERLPVAAHNAEQSLTNALKMISLHQALGIVDEPTTARLDASLADPARAEAIADAVDEQAEHFDMIGLQLGYIYPDGALLHDGEPGRSSPTRTYQPTAHPGARLPHAVTGDGGSTLDLVDPAELTLLSFGAHERWSAACRVDPPVRHVRLGLDVTVDDGWRRTCGVSPTGALLVRPDQHVAWRAEDAHITADLARAIDAVTGR